MPLSDYRYVFVVTYARSGSTLLMSILNQGHDVCLRGENKATLYHLYRAIDAGIDTARRGKNGRQTQQDMPWFGAHEVKPVRFRNQLLNAFVSTVLTPPEGTRVTGFKEIRHESAFMNDEDFAGYVSFLLTSFPDARIVFNSRDAAAVGKSAWLKDRPTTAVEKMVSTCDRRFATALQAHPDRCFLVKYEDFTADPSRYEALFAFLNLPYTPEVITRVLEKPLRHALRSKKPYGDASD